MPDGVETERYFERILFYISPKKVKIINCVNLNSPLAGWMGRNLIGRKAAIFSLQRWRQNRLMTSQFIAAASRRHGLVDIRCTHWPILSFHLTFANHTKTPCPANINDSVPYWVWLEVRSSIKYQYWAIINSCTRLPDVFFCFNKNRGNTHVLYCLRPSQQTGCWKLRLFLTYRLHFEHLLFCEAR